MRIHGTSEKRRERVRGKRALGQGKNSSSASSSSSLEGFLL
ncbi:hypothetical protein NC651_023780 [Populus alba x Populus x berolinensis]|nr:hypothetical protein NC651_023780 [Populus alba x Populus x berolinensis]